MTACGAAASAFGLALARCIRAAPHPRPARGVLASLRETQIGITVARSTTPNCSISERNFTPRTAGSIAVAGWAIDVQIAATTMEGRPPMKSLLNRIFGRKVEESPAAPPSPPEDSFEERAGWLRDRMRGDIASGFYDESEILQNAQDAFEDEFEAKELAELTAAMLGELLDEHREAERAWPVETDCDRLDAAFASLEARGIISRQNFSCCGTCGSYEIWDEIRAVGEAGGQTRGYAFYHMQDTENAAKGAGLYLNYGACNEGEEAALTIAQEIVAELERHGLGTHWDGTWEQRIGLSLDWKRRRSRSKMKRRLQ